MQSLIKSRMILFATIFVLGLSVMGNAADPGLEAAFSMQKAFVDVARQLKLSVVNIRVERTSSAGSVWPDSDDSSPGDAEEFFKRFFQGPRFNRPEKFKIQGAGSGVVIAAEGVILTNNHVVKDATKITVKMHDEKEYDAEVIGQDPQTDLAVIKVKADASLKVAEFANSDAVEVGQWCIAVGNPLGLEQTVTVGVVSALGRSGIGAATIEDFIQTDASINPGNSGGPLVDLNGKVIGINTLIFNAPGSGIGFAIPANLASRISQQIIKNGKVQRPYLGITMQPVTDELARHFDLKNRDGAVVMEIAEGSPAARSDLRAMDIIRKIDDKTMKNTNDVQKHVLDCEIDREIRLEILRNGKIKEVKVKLEQMPASYGLAAAETIPQSKLRSGTGIFEDLGFRVQQISAEMPREMNIGKDKGLVVVSVRSESPADNGGLKSGDVIVQVNGLEVLDEKNLEEALKEGNKKKSSVLLVNRAGMPMFLVVAHPEK